MSAEQEKNERNRKRKSRDQPRDHAAKRSKKGQEVEQKKDEKESNGAVVTTNGEFINGIVVPVHKKGKKEKKENKNKKQHHKDLVTWSISQPVGGWFLPQSPVFSPDEKFLILATRGFLQIYSTATSLLVRSLKVISSDITSYTLSESTPTQIYAATSTGLISTWDLDSGKGLGRWDIKANIRNVATVMPTAESGDIIFTQEAGEHHVINAHILRTGAQASQSELREVLRTKNPILSFQILSAGTILVVAFQNSIMIGKALPLSPKTLKDVEYVWREFKVQHDITCFHAHFKYQSAPKPIPQKGLSQLPPDDLDLAIGCADGVISIYDDILRKLRKIEKGKTIESEKSGNVVPRRLHWHRDAVASLKWSLDGNYLISGGAETVLVLWQMTTEKKQFLPHLTSEIENVVVSPSGTSYAVRLADNSLIVLSTTEFKAKTSIAGIQSRTIFQYPEVLRTGTIKSQIKQSSNPLGAYGKIPMAVNPLHPNQILLPIPSSQPRSETSGQKLAAPYLQTFDISTARHISRQAITRNNATNFNVGPNGLKLQEPDIKFMQLSYDGKWLATVEDWIPPPTDIEHLGENDRNAAKEQSLRREVYLKFWQWDIERGMWSLEARIETPHRFQDQLISCQVFDLVSHPTEVGFATVGEDSFVRVWKPKIRSRDGTVIRGADANALISWSNRSTIELESSVEGPESEARSESSDLPQGACLAYSADGSALAVSQDWSVKTGPGLVHLINTKSGAVQRSIPDLYTQGLTAIAFVGRYLIVVSESVTVWDVVDDELSYTYSIDLSHPEYTLNSSMVHLAVNTYDGSFALAFPDIHLDHVQPQLAKYTPRKVYKATSTVIIFDPSTPKHLHNFSLTTVVMSLLPTLNGSGYITLDSAAEVRIINPKASTSIPLILPIAQPDQSLATTEGLESEIEDMEIDDQEELAVPEAVKNTEMTEEFIEDVENDKPVVRPEQLAEIFEPGPSFGAQSMKDLFNSVIKLYARKPRVRWEQDLTGSS